MLRNMASSDNLRFVEVITNLQSVVDQIKDADERENIDPNFTLEAFWTRIEICSKAVSASATKLSLAFSGSPLPSKQEIQPLISGIEQSLLALVSAYYSLPSAQGHTLRRLLADSVVSLTSSMQCLLRALDSRSEGQNQSCSQQLQSTGSVWEMCDKLTTLPRDNTKAVLTFADEAHQLVSDALTELVEAEQSSGVERLADDVDLQDEFVNLDITAGGGWSDGDRLVLRACIGVVKTAAAAVRKVSKSISLSGQSHNAQLTAELDSYVELVQAVSPAVDDLVSSLYSPVSLPAVRTQCERVCVVVTTLLNGARCRHFTTEADSAWLDFLLKAVDHNQNKVIASINSMHSTDDCSVTSS